MSGRSVPGISCPKCGSQVVYNGNYFCENVDDCGWALSHGDNGEPVGRVDKRIWREIQDTAWFRHETKAV